MIETAVALFLARLRWEIIKVVIRLTLAVVAVLVVSCSSGQNTLTSIIAQPGGTARLKAPGTLVLGATTGPVDFGGAGFIGPPVGSSKLPAPPPAHWAVMVAASQNAPCAFPGPEWLAALAYYESNYGQNPGPSSAGAWGYAQFMPFNFAPFGVPDPQIRNPNGPGNDYRVMIPAMVAKLCKDGIGTSIDKALFAYNASQAYVEHLKSLVASWGPIARPPLWLDGPPFNQFDPANWANRQNYLTWSAAACSAASLAWVLRAYGHPVASLDGAVSLIGPGTGISSTRGLLDYTGTPLVGALGRAGFNGWQAKMTIPQLRQRLQTGPVMLDGHAWFGEGHWFVAIGSDDGGVEIRDSSGNNVRYLTWTRLMGEVGWSGWGVGVNLSPVPGNQA